MNKCIINNLIQAKPYDLDKTVFDEPNATTLKIKAPYTKETPTGMQLKALKISCFKRSNYIETNLRLFQLIESRDQYMAKKTISNRAKRP